MLWKSLEYSVCLYQIPWLNSPHHFRKVRMDRPNGFEKKSQLWTGLKKSGHDCDKLRMRHRIGKQGEGIKIQTIAQMTIGTSSSGLTARTCGHLML